ncbi:tryptophan--tRNA ligase [Nocardia asiatica]|uniref:tryptophan--tRNA ligase n=1 Tax=Nocardia asiatica TaxID=209252 RepID=UPI0002D70CFA|nr:tryptophan--tRNA ligase [Nocardia asiatica]
MSADSYQTALKRSAAIEQEVLEFPGRFRVLTGDRPTGKLHIGHYFGTLQNRVRLQDLGVALFVLIADYQVITDRDVSNDVSRNVPEIVLDYLAAGVDPNVSSIFTHSAIPELNQLVLPFLSLVTVGELERNPTVKDEIRLSNRPAVSGMMFTYPVHQAADILFMHANLVPVGKDQLPHLEVARTVARRFNERYSPGDPYFPMPEALLSKSPGLLGTDGRKMSKSLNNAICISSSPDETSALIRKTVTDAEREITYDPSTRPAVANLLTLAGLCQDRTPDDIAREIGSKGAGELKRVATESVNEYFAPIRARRRELEKDPEAVRKALRNGNEKAREIAAATLSRVQDLMGMRYY